VSKYRVRFWKNVTTCDQHSIVVEAADEEAAKQRVIDSFYADENGVELTDEEITSETLEKEGEVVESEFVEILEDSIWSPAVELVVETDAAPGAQ